MKILCLQLARLGDIYQSWPVLHALKRIHPGCEIHFMVRERFRSATNGLTAVDRVITLPNRDILAGLLSGQAPLESSLRRLGNFIDELRLAKYDRVINLSFSPVSSFLTDLAAGPGTVVLGYSRHDDGFLSIPDDASAYFYAQVGINRHNRIHVTDLFALVAGVELRKEDFCPQVETNNRWSAEDPYIVIHPGASDMRKTCQASEWREIIAEITRQRTEKIYLIGSIEESAFLEQITTNSDKVVSLAGQTTPEQLFPLLKNAKALLCCDSMAQHIASLTNTATFNITFAAVCFWETGPRADHSRIISFEKNTEVSPQNVITEFCKMLNKQPAGEQVVYKNHDFGVLYQAKSNPEADFIWDLIRALYLNEPFPAPTDIRLSLAFSRLGELADLALEQIDQVSNPKMQSIAVSILDQIDNLIEQVGQLEPSIAPIVRWFQTEKLRMGPADLNSVLETTRTLFRNLVTIAKLYDVNTRIKENGGLSEATWKS